MPSHFLKENGKFLMKQQTKKLYTLTAPSCAGKTTLVRKLLATGVFTEVLSFTSRQPRQGEVHGVDYNFKTSKECKDLVDDGLTAEHIEFKGFYYGIETMEIDSKLNSDKAPIVIVEPNGLRQLRSKFDCFAVYIDAPLLTLYSRFLSRFRLSPEADVNYEAKRAAAIKQEWEEWPLKVYSNHYIESYTDETEDAIIQFLVNKAQQPQP